MKTSAYILHLCHGLCFDDCMFWIQHYSQWNYENLDVVLLGFGFSSSDRHPRLSLFVPVKACTDIYVLVVDGRKSRKVLFNSAIFE